MLTTDEASPPNGILKIWDIRDLGRISMVAEYTANPSAIIHNVYVKGKYAHIAYYTEGYVVLDITDPAKPVKAGSYDTYPGPDGNFAGAWNVYPYFPSGKVILSDIQTGLFLFSLANQVTTVSGSSLDSPKRFSLEQNYPNPFNPSTVITYELLSQSHVTLKVYNILGREVATLVDERQDAGTKILKFDASTLSGGVYYYRIQAGSYTETKKMVLVR